MADKTYANLTTVTTTNNDDLVAVYPTGGPLKVIAWVNLVAKLVTDLTPSFLKISNNLSDLNSAGVARSNLGLGTTAVLNTGTTSGTIALLGTGGKTPISTLPGGYLSKSGTYSAVLADAGKLIDCTGTFTLTLPSASSVGETYSIDVRNSGTGTITVAPPSGTIDGASSVTISPGATRTIVNDATNYYTTPEGPQGYTLLETQSFTSGTSKTFSNISQAYSDLIFVADHITGSPASDLGMQISTDGTNYTPNWVASNSTPNSGSIVIPNYTNAIGFVGAHVGNPSTAPDWTQPSSGSANFRAYDLGAGGVKYAKFTNNVGSSYTAGVMRLYAK